MAQVEKQRIVETEGTLPDGREVKRVVDTERVVASTTEARGAETGHNMGLGLLISLGICVLAVAAIWIYFFT